MDAGHDVEVDCGGDADGGGVGLGVVDDLEVAVERGEDGAGDDVLGGGEGDLGVEDEWGGWGGEGLQEEGDVVWVAVGEDEGLVGVRGIGVGVGWWAGS